MRRNCKKNERKMYYALYKNKEMIYDDNGNPTGEYDLSYYPPVPFSASVSVGKSDSEDSPFGNDLSYDRVMITHDMALPVTESSLIWLNAVPEYEDEKLLPESADYEVAAPALDGLDSLRIAIRLRK
jgi:hypothetical protein